MHTLRFGRKLSLPSTMAIKHQVRMLMAQYEVKKAEAEARPEVFRGQPSLALPSVTPAGGSSKVNTDATKRTPQSDSQVSSSSTDHTTAMDCCCMDGMGLKG